MISGCRVKVPSEQEQEQVMEDHVILPSLCLHFAVPPFPLIEVVCKEYIGEGKQKKYSFRCPHSSVVD